MTETLVRVSYLRNGTAQTVQVPSAHSPVDDNLRQELHQFVQTLADNGQLDGPDATHELVPQPGDSPILRRKRFSAY
jgi:hypothetical protein